MTIKVFSVAEMIAAEKAADAAGLTYEQMMETAGMRVAEAICARWPVEGKRILVLVGPGNNGGDGLVAGRYLAESGAQLSVYLTKPREAVSDSNYAQLLAMGLPLVEGADAHDEKWLAQQLRTTDILIDALLGTGVSRPITGDLARLMQDVKDQLALRNYEPGQTLTDVASTRGSGRTKPFRIVAVDCPSGLNCDTGELDPLTLRADLTVTFAGPKRGHFRFPGPTACGELVVAGIGISPKLPAVDDIDLQVVTADLARTLMPRRPLDGHKGTFGTTLIAAGSGQYWGAPLLSGLGAYRAGAGLVALAVPQTIRATIAGRLPEATYLPLNSQDLLSAEDARAIGRRAFQYRSLLVGPGISDASDFLVVLMDQMRQRELGTHDNSTQSTGNSLPALVVDADGLNLLAQAESWPQRLPGPAILTPHPGEMARLTGLSPSELKKIDRVHLARERAQDWGHIVLLKGAYTVVAAPDGRCSILPFANPILAVGGSGDVLAGIIAALLSQGVERYEAAVLGGFLHGAAGQLAAGSMGRSGLLASELADWIPRAMKRLMTIDEQDLESGDRRLA